MADAVLVELRPRDVVLACPCRPWSSHRDGGASTVRCSLFPETQSQWRPWTVYRHRCHLDHKCDKRLFETRTLDALGCFQTGVFEPCSIFVVRASLLVPAKRHERSSRAYDALERPSRCWPSPLQQVALTRACSEDALRKKGWLHCRPPCSSIRTVFRFCEFWEAIPTVNENAFCGGGRIRAIRLKHLIVAQPQPRPREINMRRPPPCLLDCGGGCTSRLAEP